MLHGRNLILCFDINFLAKLFSLMFVNIFEGVSIKQVTLFYTILSTLLGKDIVIIDSFRIW